MKKNLESKKGFTLIEILVVTVILAVLGFMVTNIFFTTMRGTSKADVLREVKQNGNYALSIMERMIRNATSITTCSSPMSTIQIMNPDGQTTTFFLSGTQIASNSGSFLTNSKVQVINPPGLIFSCTRTVGKPDVVTINFSLAQAGPIAGPEEQASLSFQTTVSLRTY